ncbi:MAG: DKNYY domain-containing protein [Betaproteobacteria bacterium]|nr:DKNYY domain-containing protein [Betaproteobacteria bacterium]
MTHPRAAPAAAAVALALLAWLPGCDSKPAPAFHKVDGVWRYRDTPIPDADAATFTALSDRYAKDRAHVYYADHYRDGREYFAIRHDRVRAVAGADPATFRLLAHDYARDASRVYYEGAQIPVRDTATFVPLDDGFARDRVAGYYQQQEIAGSDGATFAVAGAHYAKDRSRVYYAEIATDDGARGPYVRAVALPDAQPATFRVLDSGYAHDAAQAWYRDRVLTRETASFAVLPFDYARSAAEVWYRGEPVRGADPATFRTLPAPADDADAADAHARYQQGRRVPPAAR